MQIIKKLLSVVLASSIIIGCGAIVNAGENDIKIDKNNFPNERLRNLISQKIDTNHDGYIDINEKYGNSHLDITDEALNSSNRNTRKCVTELTGINKLGLNSVTITSCSKLKEIDLSRSGHISYLKVVSCNGLETFIGSTKLKEIEFNWCSSLENLDLSRCSELKMLTLTNCPYLCDELDLTHSPKLETLVLNITNYKNVLFNNNTRLKELDITVTPITNIDVSKALDLKVTKKFILNTEGKLTGLRVSPTVLNILINNRIRSNGKSTEYRYYKNGTSIIIT